MTIKVAITDIGTNSVLLLIAQINPDKSYQILHDECRIARLGQGINHASVFQDEAMARTFAALQDYKKIMDDYECEQRVLIGTAAFRHAQNADAFVQRVQAELNLKIEIVDGKEEARIIHNACARDFKDLPKPFLVLDIGGGSTEFIFDDGHNWHATSLPFGSVKLTEKFFHTDPPSENEKDEMKSYLNSQLSSLKDAQSSFVKATADRRTTHDARRTLIATAGTPTTLYALHLDLPQYDSKKVHGQKMTKDELEKVTTKLESLPLAERSQLPCLPPKRADVIIAGEIILKTVMDFFDVNEFWVSDRGLRFGVLYDRFLS